MSWEPTRHPPRLVKPYKGSVEVIEPGGSYAFCDFSYMDLSGANISYSTFLVAELRMTDFTGANLEGALMGGANLSNAIFVRAHLVGANLHGANARGADFTDADMRGTHLSDADLTGASFRGADLSSSIITGTKTREADFTGAILHGCEWKNEDHSVVDGWRISQESFRLVLDVGHIVSWARRHGVDEELAEMLCSEHPTEAPDRLIGMLKAHKTLSV